MRPLTTQESQATHEGRFVYFVTQCYFRRFV